MDFPPRCFVDQGAIAFLCAWALLHRRAGRQVGFYGDEASLNYLSRLDLFRHTGFSYQERFRRHAETGRFIPALLIDGEQDVFDASNAICDPGPVNTMRKPSVALPMRPGKARRAQFGCSK